MFKLFPVGEWGDWFVCICFYMIINYYSIILYALLFYICLANSLSLYASLPHSQSGNSPVPVFWVWAYLSYSRLWPRCWRCCSGLRISNQLLRNRYTRLPKESFGVRTLSFWRVISVSADLSHPYLATDSWAAATPCRPAGTSPRGWICCRLS